MVKEQDSLALLLHPAVNTVIDCTENLESILGSLGSRQELWIILWFRLHELKTWVQCKMLAETDLGLN